jgi:hypothetical protein
MAEQSERKPVAIANWKMSMTAFESLSFVGQFHGAVDDLAQTLTSTLIEWEPKTCAPR